MKRFEWPLHHLLEVTSHREQALRAQLLMFSQKIAGLRQMILAREAVLSALLTELSYEDIQERFSKQEIFMNYAQNDKEQIRQFQDQVKELESLRKETNARFLQLRSSRKALERLREEAKIRH